MAYRNAPNRFVKRLSRLKDFVLVNHFYGMCEIIWQTKAIKITVKASAPVKVKYMAQKARELVRRGCGAKAESERI